MVGIKERLEQFMTYFLKRIRNEREEKLEGCEKTVGGFGYAGFRREAVVSYA